MNACCCSGESQTSTTCSTSSTVQATWSRRPVGCRSPRASITRHASRYASRTPAWGVFTRCTARDIVESSSRVSGSDVACDGVDVDGPERRGGVRWHAGVVGDRACGPFGVEQDAAEAALVVPHPRPADEAGRRLDHPDEEVEFAVLLLFAPRDEVHLEDHCVHGRPPSCVSSGSDITRRTTTQDIDRTTQPLLTFWPLTKLATWLRLARPILSRMCGTWLAAVRSER